LTEAGRRCGRGGDDARDFPEGPASVLGSPSGGRAESRRLGARGPGAAWTKFADIRATFNSADVVGEYVVFNVGGNKCRIVAEVIYDTGQLVLIRGVYTHAEYDSLDLA